MRQHEEIKEDIIKFLNLCITYSEGSLNRKRKRLARLSEEDKIEMAKNEIKKWESYKQFTEHTIKELLKGDLDEWIENLNNPILSQFPKID